MTKRRYSPRCAECHQKTMAIATVAYDIKIDHDGKKYDIHLPALSVPKCSNCGAISIDDAASEQIDIAFHQAANLLTPEQIAKLRDDLKLTQKDLAALMGISDSTLSRWESGTQIQQRAFDCYLRLVFASSWVRWYLAAFHAGRITGIPKEIVQARSPVSNFTPSDYQAPAAPKHAGSVLAA